MIKILYVVNSLKSGGPINQLFNLISNLDKSSFKASILILTNQINEAERERFEAVTDHLIISSGSIINLQKHRLKIKQFINSISPDIVHSQGIISDIITFTISFKARWVITSHNFPFEDYPMKFGLLKGYLMALAHSFAQKKCPHTIACSKSIEHKLKTIGINSIAIQNGVSNPHVSKEKNPDLKVHTDFIAVGSLIPRKNMRQLIEVFNFASKNKYDIGNLIILGDGPEYHYLKKNSCDKINVLGAKKDVYQYLNKSKIYISFSKSEGLPMSALEALSIGLPLILSNIPAHFEIYESCPNSVELIDINLDHQKLLESLVLAKNKFENYDSQKSIDKYEAYFSSKAMTENYQFYYKSIV